MRLTLLTVPLLAAAATQLPFTAATAAGPDVGDLEPLGLVPGLAVPVAAPAAASSDSQAAVEVQDNRFSPSRIEIEVGDTVVWTQTGSNPHTVTANDGSFDSHPNCSELGSGDCMQQGDTFSHTFQSPGEVAYNCRVHEEIGMTGVIVVKAKSTPPPARDPVQPPADTDSGDGGETTAPTLPDTGADPAVGVAASAVLIALGGLVLSRRRLG